VAREKKKMAARLSFPPKKFKSHATSFLFFLVLPFAKGMAMSDAENVAGNLSLSLADLGDSALAKDHASRASALGRGMGGASVLGDAGGSDLELEFGQTTGLGLSALAASHLEPAPSPREMLPRLGLSGLNHTYDASRGAGAGGAGGSSYFGAPQHEERPNATVLDSSTELLESPFLHATADASNLLVSRHDAAAPLPGDRRSAVDFGAESLLPRGFHDESVASNHQDYDGGRTAGTAASSLLQSQARPGESDSDRENLRRLQLQLESQIAANTSAAQPVTRTATSNAPSRADVLERVRAAGRINAQNAVNLTQREVIDSPEAGPAPGLRQLEQRTKVLEQENFALKVQLDSTRQQTRRLAKLLGGDGSAEADEQATAELMALVDESAHNLAMARQHAQELDSQGNLLDAARDTIERLEQEIHDVQNQSNGSDAEEDARQHRELELARHAIQIQTEQNRGLEEQLRQQTQRVEELERASAQDVGQANTKVAELSRQLATARDEVDEMAVAQSKHERELKQAEEAAAAAKKHANDLAAELAQLQHNLKDADNRAAEAEQRAGAVAHEAEQKSNAVVEGLRRDLDDVKNQLVDHEQEGKQREALLQLASRKLARVVGRDDGGDSSSAEADDFDAFATEFRSILGAVDQLAIAQASVVDSSAAATKEATMAHNQVVNELGIQTERLARAEAEVARLQQANSSSVAAARAAEREMAKAQRHTEAAEQAGQAQRGHLATAERETQELRDYLAQTRKECTRIASERDIALRQLTDVTERYHATQATTAAPMSHDTSRRIHAQVLELSTESERLRAEVKARRTELHEVRVQLRQSQRRCETLQRKLEERRSRKHHADGHQSQLDLELIRQVEQTQRLMEHTQVALKEERQRLAHAQAARQSRAGDRR
jgi:hypothetical protein